MSIKTEYLHVGDNVEFMRTMPDGCVDLTVTSPPYDDLRTYNGFSWDFESVARELYRITKDGGVVVWVVGDETRNGSESLSSFKQAIYMREIGFNLHDTMIWNKGGFSAVGSLRVRYAPVFEYMFVFSKGKPRVFHPIKDRPNKWAGSKNHGTVRLKDGSTKPVSNDKVIAEYGQRFNIWEIPPHRQKGENVHPAPFPEQLALDHITSWSNPGDIVFDPFLGSGTTAKMAMLSGRKYVGCDISADYVAIAQRRIDEAMSAI